MYYKKKNIIGTNMNFTAWIQMGCALVALIIGIIALALAVNRSSPGSSPGSGSGSGSGLSEAMKAIDEQKNNISALTKKVTTLEGYTDTAQLTLSENKFTVTNANVFIDGTPALMISSNKHYVAIRAYFKVVGAYGEKPVEIGQLERSLGNGTHYGRVFCVLTAPPHPHVCLLRIDDDTVYMTAINAAPGEGSGVYGGGVFPIIFEKK